MCSYCDMHCEVHYDTQLCRIPKDIIWPQFCLLFIIVFQPMHSERFRLISVRNPGLKNKPDPVYPPIFDTLK